jgi:tyrosine-protein phosphatase SIW14
MKTFSQHCHVLSLTLTLLSGSAFAATVNAPGVPNFHQVNEHLYRGAQPSDEGFKNLAKLGIKTVIDLRRPTEHSTEAEEQVVKSAGMKYINIPMQGVVAPTDESVAKALSLMLAEADGPVFVHCKRGADRTGAVIAVYRMSHDRWGNSQAVHEAKSLGMSWTQIGLKHYISTYKPKEAVTVAADAAPATVTP